MIGRKKPGRRAVGVDVGQKKESEDVESKRGDMKTEPRIGTCEN